MSWTTSEKFPAELSKLLSTCPVDHFENECHVFWNFRKFLNFSDKCLDLWLKFSAAFPNVHSSCPKYFFGFFVNGFHVFLNFGLRQKNISFEKKIRHFCWNCILCVPRTFWGVFIKNVSVFQFSLVFQAKFIELPAEIFQQSSKMLFEPKRFELGRNFWTELSKMHYTCPEEHFDEKIVGCLK